MSAEITLGIFLALAGAATLALSMVVQRYSLSFPDNKVPVLSYQLPSNVVWFFGLVLYGGANGFYAVALQYGISIARYIYIYIYIFL